MTNAERRPSGRQLEDLLAGRPPVPNRARFQPLRLGLIGIWEYAEQEFHFHDGRLILKGRNGSGKTKVLEVTSPFLFDADLTARRLDPFGTAARSMRDNLLFGDQTHRIGYVWCEYGRMTESGAPEYCTLGAGLRSQRSRPGAPESWYFTTSLRPGADFSLLDAERSPLSQSRLVEMLGSASVFPTAASYRAVVADRLLGTTPERFHSLVELLIALRRPKLSENFGIDKLTSMLTHALPPVDEGMVDELARGFDELAIDQEDLARIEAGSRAIDLFLGVYREYARHVVQRSAARVRSSVTAYDDVTRQKTAADRELSTATALQEELHRQRDELDLQAVAASARIRALEQRPEIEQHAVLLQLERQAESAERTAAAAQDNLSEAAAEHDEVTRELDAAENRLEEEEATAAETQGDALALAERSGLRLEHEMQADRVWTDTSAADRALSAVVTARRSAAARVRVLRAAVTDADLAVDKAESARDDAVARRARTVAQVLGRRSELDAQVEAVTHAVLSWIDDCREITIDPRTAAELIDLVQTAGEPGTGSIQGSVFAVAIAPERALLAAKSDVDVAIGTQHTELAAIAAERDLVESRHDEPPPAPAVARRDRTPELPGAPLWKLLDFAEGLSEEDRAGTEAAFQGAGLLDAWVLPDGTALAPDTLEVVVRPSVALTGGSVATVLTAVPSGGVPEDAVRKLLGCISLRETDEPEPPGTWVSRSGSWSIGPLHGRTASTTASYIGAAAREAARRQRLAELAQRHAAADAVLDELLGKRQEFDRRLARLDEERSALPDDRAVREARGRLDGALEQASAAEAEAQEAERRWNARRDEALAVQQELDAFAEQHQIDPAENALAALEAALTGYREAVITLVAQVQRVLDLRSVAVAVRERHERQRAALRRHEEAAQEAREFAAEAREEFQARDDLVGADVDEVLRELETARTSLTEIQEEAKALRDAVTETAHRVGAAESDLSRLEEDRVRQEAERTAAVAGFDRLRTHGFLTLVEMFGAAADKLTLTRTVDEARRAAHLLREVDDSEKAQNAARNAVDQKFRELQQSVGSADWRPWGENEGTLFLARITYNGIDHDMVRMQEILGDEIETRRTLLDDRERELFGKVLVGKVGEHLRSCRRQALELVDRMNLLLRQRPTASGLLMELKWDADPEAGEDTAHALRLLDSQAPRYLSPESRTELIDFLVKRVETVRDRDSPDDWKTRLREALDYRNWCQFRIRVRKSDEPWHALTDGMHQQGSGGEKAVMLQLPLFVAAAAHYQALGPTAPHPVYLDEAFAGIDAEMRGHCMGLLTDLDLDFVMASHDEWGFHEEVPGVATYELFRDPGQEGVLATPFIWDGKRDHRLSDPLAVASDHNEIA